MFKPQQFQALLWTTLGRKFGNRMYHLKWGCSAIIRAVLHKRHIRHIANCKICGAENESFRHVWLTALLQRLSGHKRKSWLVSSYHHYISTLGWVNWRLQCSLRRTGPYSSVACTLYGRCEAKGDMVSNICRSDRLWIGLRTLRFIFGTSYNHRSRISHQNNNSNGADHKIHGSNAMLMVVSQMLQVREAQV
jgi:hypothetical protein